MTIPLPRTETPLATGTSVFLPHPVNERLEPPHFADGAAPDLWVDEAIWGHRLYDEQTPWLSLLECFGIAWAEERRAGAAFQEPASRRLAYVPLIQLRLRNILFNSPTIALIAERGGPDAECWEKWQLEIRKNIGGIVEPDFTYLRTHFQSFRDFAAVVQFLRSSTVEGVNNKRWSSQFIFPFGPAALYEDLNVVGTSVSSDRRFFGRTGELLYLMLCRSGKAPEVRAAISERFFDRSLVYGRLVGVLQGVDEEGRSPRTGAYLPYERLSDFSDLAADWLAILGRSLPGYDALPHLVTMSGLHLLLYLLRRAHAESGEATPLTMVAEIVSPRKTVVRDISANSFAANNLLPQRAVERWIARVQDTESWRHAVADPDDPAGAALAVLRATFSWAEGDEVNGPESTPATLLATLQKGASDRHQQHFAKIHGNWARLIGLASRRASRRMRYAPTDALLKTLVICCVDGRMEFRDFVALLRDRYALVIGDHQAGEFTSSGDADVEAFAANQARLEERLSSLGLVRRLSDQCAYVENPFYRSRPAGATA